MSDMQRREVFSSFASRFKKVDTSKIRPPYCDDANLFYEHCKDCEEKPCSSVCEEKIISIDEEGIPYISFKDSGCTYCDKCAVACDKGVLALTCEDKYIKTKVSIATNECLAWRDVMCSSCLDVCDVRAIKFFGVFRPTIDKDICTSCGFCDSVCPTNAISFKT
jgi:ferredoxin-type protein NapF